MQHVSNMAFFEHVMKKMWEASEKAHEWFKDKPTQNWSRSHFPSFTKCDMLVNNICENFNKCILDPRSKTILGLVEGVINFIMGSLQNNKEKMNK